MKNVFTTELQATNAQGLDFSMWKSSKPQMPEKYWVVTTAWSAVQKREDAEEWFYEVCPVGVQTHTQKEAEPSWYPSDDI